MNQDSFEKIYKTMDNIIKTLKVDLESEDELIDLLIRNPDVELTESGLKEIGLTDKQLDSLFEDNKIEKIIEERKNKRFKDFFSMFKAFTGGI